MRALDPRLLRHARAGRAYVGVCVVLGVAWAGLTVVQATLLADGISSVFLDGVALPEGLWWLAAVMAARAAVTWAQEVAAQRVAAAVKSGLRMRLLTHLTRLGPAWLGGERTGELATLATRGLDALDAYFSRYLPQLVLAVVAPAVILARIVPADLIAGVTILLTLPLIPAFMVLIGRGAGERARGQYRLLARLSHHFLDVVAGLPTLRVFGRANAQVRTIGAVTDRYRRATMRTLRLAFLSSLVLELVATLSVALVAVGIGLRLVGGSLDLATALLVLILAPEAYLPLRQLAARHHASVEGRAAADDVVTVLESRAPSPGRRRPDGGRASLRLDNVTVRYPGCEVPAVDGLSLTVSPGEFVALAGPTGCGKSTVLSALLGLVRPESGRVWLGGVEADDAAPDAWRSLFSWVPQRPHLVAGTIAENVRLGRPDAGDAAVRAACAAAAVTFVDDLPLGLSTPIGEGGRGLSAGQRQRVALARAFLRDAPIALLDEPTANLDEGTEAVVIESLRRFAQGRTVVLVAHRPALLALADRVVPLAPVPARP